jgi:hypothetical protein
MKGNAQLLHSLPRVNLCTLKAMALFLHELSESSGVTLMGLGNFAIVFAPCWLRNPSNDPNSLLLNTNFEIAFAKEALAVLGTKEFAVQEDRQISSQTAVIGLLEVNDIAAPKFPIADDEHPIVSNVTPLKPKSSKLYARRAMPSNFSNVSVSLVQLRYLGVALEEQFMCEWSGLRIPAILSGMLTALSTPVDVMLEALSCAAVLSDDAAAAVFAELEARERNPTLFS